MKKNVHLYIKSDRIDRIRNPRYGQGEHLKSGGEDVSIIDGSVIISNEKDIQVREMLDIMARQYEFELIIHDISLRSERRKAFFKRSKLPAPKQARQSLVLT